MHLAVKGDFELGESDIKECFRFWKICLNFEETPQIRATQGN